MSMRTVYNFPDSSSARQFWLRMNTRGIKAFQLNGTVSVWANEQNKPIVQKFAESLSGNLL